MQTLLYNLTEYENRLSLTRPETLQLAEITQNELDAANNNISRRTLAKICANLSIKFSTLYSDNGFEEDTVENQYLDAPAELRKSATRVLLRKIAKMYGSEDMLRTKLLNVLPGSKCAISRWISGTGYFGSTDFNFVKEGIADVCSSKKFNNILAEALFLRIANYNVAVAREALKVDFKQVGQAIGKTESLASNWGGGFLLPVPDCHIEQLASSLGDFYEYEFATKILAPYDFRNREFHLLALPELPDPIGIEPVKAHKKKVKAVTVKAETSNPFTDIPAIPIDIAPAAKPVVINTSSSAPSIPVTEEVATKLLAKLPPEAKNEVYSLIVAKFFETL